MNSVTPTVAAELSPPSLSPLSLSPSLLSPPSLSPLSLSSPSLSPPSLSVVVSSVVVSPSPSQKASNAALGRPQSEKYSSSVSLQLPLQTEVLWEASCVRHD